MDFYPQCGVHIRKGYERIPLSIRTLKIVKIITLKYLHFKDTPYFRTIFPRSKPVYDWNDLLDNSIIIES